MQFKKILVAVDFSENSDYAFDYALSLARERNSFLQVVHVINQLSLTAFLLKIIIFIIFASNSSFYILKRLF